jgi:hypothetical protein
VDALRILVKTDKGRDEVASRSHGLGPRERSVLILVDGKVSAGLLADKLKHLPRVTEILEQLERDGFIAVPEDQPIVTGGAAGGKVPLDAGGRAAVAFARRFVLDTLGPNGDTLAEQLEKCASQQELLGLLEKCRELLRMAAGRRKADEFWSGLGSTVGGP